MRMPIDTERELAAWIGMADSIIHGVVIVDKSGEIIHMNRHLSELLGYTDGEATGLRLAEIIDESGMPGDTNTTDQYFAMVRTKDGKRIRMRVTGATIGERYYFFMLQTEEELVAEHSLREERERLQAYLEIAGVIFIALDKNGNITMINRAGTELFGYSQEEMIGRSWFEFVPDRVREEVRKGFQRLMSGDVEHIRMTRAIVTKELGERVIDWNTVIVRDKQGRIVGLISSGQDITEVLEVQKNLEQSEEKYRSVIEQALAGFAILTKKGEIIFVNPAMSKFLGFEESGSLSVDRDTAQNVLHPDDIEKMGKFIRVCMTEGSHEPIRVRVIRKDGAVRWLELIGKRVEFQQEAVVQVLAIDTTQRVKLEEAMQRQHEALIKIANSSMNIDDMRDVGKKILQAIASEFGFDGGVLRLYNPDQKAFDNVVSLGLGADQHTEAVGMDNDEYLAVQIAKTRTAQFFDDVEHNSRLERFLPKFRKLGVRALVVIPIIGDEQEILGIISLFNRSVREFIPEDIKFLRTLGRGLSNILKRFAIQRELLLSEEQLRRLMTDIDEGVVVIEFGGGVKFANEKFQKMVGYDLQELLQMGLDDVVHHDDIELLKNEIPKRLDEKSSIFTFRIIRKDGGIRVVRASAVPYKDRKGQTIGSISIITDLTEQILAEQRLKESERKFRKFFENLPIGIQFIEFREPDQFILIDTNQSAIRIMGKGLEHLIGKNLADAIQEDHREHLQHYFEVIQTGKPWHNEKIREDNGQITRAVESFVFKVIPNLLAVVIMDTTDRVRAERELQQMNEQLSEIVRIRTEKLESANRELEAFAYSVSHDLRAPLRSVDGFSKAILEDYDGILDETGKDYLHRLRTAAIRMGQMIDDILNLSRITRVTVTRERVNLSQLVKEILERLRETDAKRSIQTVIEKDIIAECDRHLIEIALQNLLSNAWKYTRKKPHAIIEFGQEEQNGKRVFFIKDNGVGFNMKYVDRLFVPFQRLHKTSEFEGTGIGLSIVKRIIDKHGGKIWVESKPNEGTIFYFTITE